MLRQTGPLKNKTSIALLAFLCFFAVLHIATPLISAIYFKTLLHNSQIESSYDGPNRPPIEVGAVDGVDGAVGLSASFSFIASENTNYPNLFQTASGNSGVRLELSGNVLAMIVGTQNQSSPPVGVLLSRAVKLGTRHTVELLAVKGSFIDVIFDGSRVASQVPKSFSTSDVRFGNGFDDTRNFAGKISDVSFYAGKLGFLGQMLFFLNKYFWPILCVAFLMLLANIVCRVDVQDEDIVRAGDTKRVISATLMYINPLILFVSLSFIAAGVIYIFAYNYFLAQYVAFKLDVLAGFRSFPGARPFKEELTIFLLLELSLIFSLGLMWTADLLTPRWRPSVYSTATISIAVCCISAVAAVFVHDRASRSMFALAFLTPIASIIARRIVQKVPEKYFAYLSVSTAYLFQLPVGSYAAVLASVDRHRLPICVTTVAKSKLLRLVSVLVLTGLAVYPMVRAWYPIVLPNDYMELSDFGLVGAAKVPVDRNTLVRCLLGPEISNLPSAGGDMHLVENAACPAEGNISRADRADLGTAIQSTGGWQSEAGRLLFHHSYLYVPAKHFLTYGLDGAVPYLYGYGNTIFYAGLMLLAGGPSLTNYLTTFPIAEFAGILAAAALVFTITRNATAALVGFLLSLSAFYLITFVPVFLAASFSPLRLFGLSLQIGATAFFCRSRSSLRFAILPLSAAASLFWNREFGQIGAIGQALIIVAPQIVLSLRTRILLMVGLLACVAFGSIYPTTSQDIVNTVGLSFFNISQQSMPKRDLAWFLLYLGVAHAALFMMSLAFEGKERALRIVLIPVLALSLMKYVFNPAAPHFYIMCTLLWPVALIYLPWRTNRSRNSGAIFLPQPYPALICIAVLCLTVQRGMDYRQEAEDFRVQYVEPFDHQPWSGLNESVSFVAPEKPILSRVNAIQGHLLPGDKVLFLSPFDHVLSFYINPQSYCGHFDLLTNFATKTVADLVAACAAESKQLLVVYDRALEIPCPTDTLQLQPICRQRAQMKYNLTSFRDSLLSILSPAGNEGDLTFYRGGHVDGVKHDLVP